MLADTDIERALFVCAHPDDVDFGAAGTAAVWSDAGIEVAYCIVTDGDAGGFDDGITREEMAALRRKEQIAAAAIVGVTDVTFLAYPDGRLESSIALRRDISREIRRVRPQVVLGQSPERLWSRIFASHPDHLAAGEATVCAVYPDARNPYAHPELLEEGWEPWTVAELWLMAVESPDRFVDITPAVDRKIEALMCHVSQHQDPVAIETMVRAWTTATAAAAGLPEGAAAEAFRVVSTAS
jgi:LmbE family N-acetylglucosaminyl deacetylase